MNITPNYVNILSNYIELLMVLIYHYCEKFTIEHLIIGANIPPNFLLVV